MQYISNKKLQNTLLFHAIRELRCVLKDPLVHASSDDLVELIEMVQKYCIYDSQPYLRPIPAKQIIRGMMESNRRFTEMKEQEKMTMENIEVRQNSNPPETTEWVEGNDGSHGIPKDILEKNGVQETTQWVEKRKREEELIRKDEAKRIKLI